MDGVNEIRAVERRDETLAARRLQRDSANLPIGPTFSGIRRVRRKCGDARPAIRSAWTFIAAHVHLITHCEQAASALP
jgi:hypothetical protein